MKKILIILLAFISTFCSGAALVAFADGSARIYADDEQVYQGNYVYIDVRAENLADIGSLDVYLLYDQSVFTYRYNSAGELTVDSICETETGEGELVFRAVSLEGISGTGRLWQAAFSVKSDAPAGTYTIGIAVGEAYTTALTAAQISSGSCKVQVMQSSASTDTMYVRSRSASCGAGETAQVWFYTYDARNIASAEFEIEYDTEFLAFEKVEIGAALTSANGALYSVNSTVSGYIKASYASLSGVNGYVEPLISCTFTVLKNVDYSAEVALTVNGGYNSALEPISVNKSTARVQINYVTPEVVAPAIFPSEYIGEDKNFTVSVWAEAATKLAAGDFVVNYNADLLSCVSVEKGAVEGFAVVNPNYSEGEIRFSFVCETGLISDGEIVRITFSPVGGKVFESRITIGGKNLVDAEFNGVTVEYKSARIAVSHNIKHIDAQLPTCSTIGWEAYDICVNCNHSTYKELPALGHDLVHHEAKSPTRTEIGWEAYDTCSRCDYTTYAELPANGHTPATAVAENRVEATCTADGHYDSVVYCSVCGEELSRVKTTISATGHTASEAVIENRVEATCTTDGSYETVVYCSVCGEELSRENVTIPAFGHEYDYVNIVWSWAEDYSKATAMVKCIHDNTHTKDISAVITSDTKEATETEDGETVYTATITVDGQIYIGVKTVKIPAKGQDKKDEDKITIGCGSMIDGDGMVVGVASVVLALAVVVYRNRKRNK